MIRRCLLFLVFSFVMLSCTYQRTLITKAAHLNLLEYFRMVASDIRVLIQNKESYCDHISEVSFEGFEDGDSKTKCIENIQKIETLMIDTGTILFLMNEMHKMRDYNDEWLGLSKDAIKNFRSILSILPEIGIDIPYVYKKTLDEVDEFIDRL